MAIQAGRLSFERQPTRIAQLLRESCETHEPMARDKGLQLRTGFVDDGAQVLCDRDRIRQVLSNLIGNAIKFCEPGDAITLRREPHDEDVLIAVRDTGPGIPAAERATIFEAYKTIDRQGRGARGTGLGLYIAKGIVERHGGQIWVESEAGVGATFFFTLPRV